MPLLLLSLVLLPWLPMDLPAPLLLWSGRLSLLVWLAVAACLVPEFLYGVARGRSPSSELTAGVLALVIGAASFWQVSSQVPGGDEPHYLVITQSLLKDGDLKIENNHRERHYAPYFNGVLPPDFIVRGRDKQIYSIHAPGVSAIVAPVFAVAGYPGTVLLLLVISALGSALAWHLAWLVTGRADAAWFGWAAVTLSATWIFHSFTVYPDGPAAVLVLTGAWALMRAEQEAATDTEAVSPWLWHGAALSLLPWLHTRFSVLAAGLGALVLLRLGAVQNPAAKAFAFLAVPSLSFLGWLAYFIGIYGTPDPTAPYGIDRSTSGFQFVPDGLAGLLFDQGFGLLAYAPVLVFGFVGIGVMLAQRRSRRAALEHLFVLVPYLIVVTHYAMWWGGRSAPARFFVAVLLWMAIPAAAAWASMARRATRASAVGALLFTAFASAVLVVASDGWLAFNEREVPANWLPWLNGMVDLPKALPMWWRNREAPLFRGILIWGAAAMAAWLGLRALEQARTFRRATFGTITALLFATAASAAAAVSWRVEGVPGTATTPSQLDLLRELSIERKLLAFELSPFTRLSRHDVPSQLRIEPAVSNAPGGAGRSDRPLYALPAIPAGEYRLVPSLSGSSGWVMVGIGRDQFSIRTEELGRMGQALPVSLPIDVRALLLRVDDAARRNIRGLVVEPVRIVLPEDRLSDGFARQAVRYGTSTTYFLDGASFPEPGAFWVGGSRSSEIVIQPDDRRATATLLLRNGGADNTLLVSTKGWREEMRLGPGEERHLQVPLDHTRGATLFRFTTSSGFRPSAVDPNSRDHRFLGVWVRVN